MKLTKNFQHHLFTSESVAPGHPDKICDQISDAILDAILAIDKQAKVACECFITSNYLLIGGEVHSAILQKKQINLQELATNTAKIILNNLGYNNDTNGFNVNTCEIKVLIHEQSPDILQGVELNNQQLGAGDQGIMIGYACDQTANYMPLPVVLAHELLKRANYLRLNNQFAEAKADMKAQVTIDQIKSEDLKIHTILMSIQHDRNYNKQQFKTFIKTEIMDYVAKKYDLNTDFDYLINPTGQFVIGGPEGDTGLTGRKVIVDTYGGAACHGGGAFSGKDATKVDRTGAYYARYIAKNIVAAGFAKRCEIQIAYAIGVTKPISIFVNTHNTIIDGINESDLTKIIIANFDCSIKAMIEQLNLQEQKYLPLATYGHMGREDLNVAWEKLDKVALLKQFLPAKKSK